MKNSIEKAKRRPPLKQPTQGTQARAQATREAILHAAIEEFSRNGFGGGRIENIAKISQTHDRMIYYYFGSKESLYVEALKTVYKEMNAAEAALVLNLDDPAQALTAIVHFTWQYYLDHPELITLLNTENLHCGVHLRKSRKTIDLVSPKVGLLETILKNGAASGLFRDDVRARDLYISIASLGYFYLSNKYTLRAFLDEDLENEMELAHWRTYTTDMILRSVLAKPGAVKKQAKSASVKRQA